MTDITPIDAIAFLQKKANHIRFGKDTFSAIIALIRELVAKRKELQIRVDHLEAELHLRQTARKHRVPFETEGNGTWDVDLAPHEDPRGQHFIPTRKCICQGFYKPVNCPIHSRENAGL